ncbi:MAG: daptide biosynthesis intramembrane metalloprotease [Microbacterium sp.]
MTVAAPPASFPESARPELGARITIDAPLGRDGVWIIAHDGVPKARISEAVATVARCFTGSRSIREIAQELGDPWTPVDVGEVARRLADSGMLVVEGAGRKRRSSRHWRYRPPLTVQFSIGDPGPLFDALRPVTRIIMGAPGMIAAVIVLVAGIVAAALTAADIVDVLERPVALPVVIALGAAIILTTIVHEMGHGATLSRFGGSPRRLGAMLFYLAPAFFCDVTDGWRLGARGQRVAVALAGPVVHLLCAAASILVSSFVDDPLLHAGLVLYALSCLAITALNLLPFVQLDGYLALMSALDHPHLRRHAMRAASNALGGALLGTRSGESGESVVVRHHGWLVVYGIACRLFPVMLVGLVLYRYSVTIAGLGAIPAASYLLTLALVIAVAAVGLVRGARAVRTRAPSPWRTVVTIGVSATAAAAVLFCIPIQPTNQVGYALEGDEVRLVAATAHELPPAGTRVALESNGILLRDSLGTATVGAQEPSAGEADLAALVPISASALTAPAVTTRLVDVEKEAALPDYGRAVFADDRAHTIATWLWQTFLLRPVAALGSETR